mgnify:CR=1 FL=1
MSFFKSGLSARLVVINSLGLLGFFTGILVLGQTRESLTDAYTQSLEVQAQIIAEALGESAGDETGAGELSTLMRVMKIPCRPGKLWRRALMQN